MGGFKGQSRAFRAAAFSIQQDNWQPPKNQIADLEVNGEINLLNSLARDLVRNNAIASSIMSTLIDYLSGTGLTPTGGDQGAMDVFNEWSEDCSITGQGNFESCYRDICAAQAESGEVLLNFVMDKSATGIKSRIQLIESDRVGTPNNFVKGVDKKGRFVRQGVVYDKLGREVGFYVSKVDNGSVLSGFDDQYDFFPVKKNERLSTLLLRRPSKRRPGESRQYSMFAPMIQQIRDVDDLFDAFIHTARTKSLLGVALETDAPDAVREAMQQDTTITDNNNMWGEPNHLGNMSSGSVFTLPAGTKPHIIVPQGSVDIDVLIKRAVRLIGASMAIPYELVMRDYSDTNFSSGKLALDGFYKMINRWNRVNSQLFANPIYKNIIFEAYLNNDPRVPVITPEILNVQWIGASTTYNADPKKEADGEKIRIDNNLTTQEIICNEKGSKIEDILDSKARIYNLKRQIERQYKIPEFALDTPTERKTAGTEADTNKSINETGENNEN